MHVPQKRQPRSGGFHLFGSRHEPKSVSSRSSGGFRMGADMRRRVLMAAENISAEVTRAVEEVTPAGTAVASIAAEASGPRVA